MEAMKAPGCLGCVLPMMGLLALLLLLGWGMAPAHSAAVGKEAKVLPAKARSTASLSFTDLSGKSYSAAQLSAKKANLFLFVSSQCPISSVYAPRMTALAQTYGAEGVGVFAVYANAQEGLAEITRHALLHGLTFPVIRDARSALADLLGATVTPQAIVVDSQGEIRYRGRIDDNAVATKVTSHDLTDALNAILKGRPIHVTTRAFGCAIRRLKTPVTAGPGVPTYAKEVARILQAKCEGCHRPGEVAPFSLQTFAQASAWANDIKTYTQNGQMPPWKPAPDYGPGFKDQELHSLTDPERATLARWADAGAPLGDTHLLPPARKFATGWSLGEPDLVVTPERAFHLGADGGDVFRNFVIKTNFPEDRYVRAVEVKPGNRAVVHHVINFVDPNGESDRLEGKEHDGEPGYSSFGGPGFQDAGIISGWAPGNNPTVLPESVGMLLPKGARIVVQIHYHKDGKPETDRTRIGLYFARSTVEKQLVSEFIINFLLNIKPGDPHYVKWASQGCPEDMHLVSVLPHMHWLGKQIKVWAKLPDETVKPIVWIKDWDFNWQGTYYLKEPMALPKGSKLYVEGIYDNSENNLRNPERKHPKLTHFGEQTTDEMLVAFVGLTRDSEHLAYKTTSEVRNINVPGTPH